MAKVQWSWTRPIPSLEMAHPLSDHLVRDLPTARDQLGLLEAILLCVLVASMMPASGPHALAWKWGSATAMGVAAWLVWRKVGFRDEGIPLELWGFQLLVELALGLVMFSGSRIGKEAFVLSVLLWFSTLMTLVAFCRVSLADGLLMVPVLFWATFLTIALMCAAAESHPDAH
jgi:hypothetical protein